MKRKRRRKGYFDDLQDASMGGVGLGVGAGIAAGVQAQAPAGSPSITSGFSAITSFAPIGVTAIGAKTVLKQVKKLKKKKKGINNLY